MAIETTSSEITETDATEQRIMLSTPKGISFFSRDTQEVQKMLRHFNQSAALIISLCEKLGLECTNEGAGMVHVYGDREKIVDLLMKLQPMNLIVGD